MAKGQKTGGRTKGTANKVTQDVRAAIIEVATKMGGAAGMLSWVKKDEINERIFWSQIYPKTLPKEIKQEVTGKDGKDLTGPTLNLTLNK